LKKSSEKLFAVTAPGLEAVCAAELMALGMADVQGVTGGVEFTGSLKDLYRANLWLRSASRVLVRVGEVKASDFPELFRKAVRLPWGKFIRPDAGVQVRAVSHHSRLGHTGRIETTVGKAVDRALGRPASPPEARQQIVVRFEKDVALLSVDSSGALLHRRGYRGEAVAAPLRETLAAGILGLLGWDGTVPLADPMCGSGTFLIEGALLAANRAPGLAREFAFLDWPGSRPGLWEVLRSEARAAIRPPVAAILGSDRDAGAVAAARRNADRAGVAAWVDFQERDLSRRGPLPGPGLAVCNPPYGKRLGRGSDLRTAFEELGRSCREAFPGWRVAFLCPDERLARATGLHPEPVALLVNGGIRVALMVADL
jgi:putative N6-adenine-specific DNA methylase